VQGEVSLLSFCEVITVHNHFSYSIWLCLLWLLLLLFIFMCVCACVSFMTLTWCRRKKVTVRHWWRQTDIKYYTKLNCKQWLKVWTLQVHFWQQVPAQRYDTRMMTGHTSTCSFLQSAMFIFQSPTLELSLATVKPDLTTLVWLQQLTTVKSNVM